MASSAAAVIVAKAKRDIVSHFMSANAVAAAGAVRFEPKRLIQRRMLRRFVRRGVVVETAPDTFYLDVPAYDADRRTRRTRAAVVIAGVAVVGAAIAALA